MPGLVTIIDLKSKIEKKIKSGIYLTHQLYFPNCQKLFVFSFCQTQAAKMFEIDVERGKIIPTKLTGVRKGFPSDVFRKDSMLYIVYSSGMRYFFKIPDNGGPAKKILSFSIKSYQTAKGNAFLGEDHIFLSNSHTLKWKDKIQGLNQLELVDDIIDQMDVAAHNNNPGYAYQRQIQFYNIKGLHYNEQKESGFVCTSQDTYNPAVSYNNRQYNHEIYSLEKDGDVFKVRRIDLEPFNLEKGDSPNEFSFLSKGFQYKGRTIFVDLQADRTNNHFRVGYTSLTIWVAPKFPNLKSSRIVIPTKGNDGILGFKLNEDGDGIVYLAKDKDLQTHHTRVDNGDYKVGVIKFI